MAVGLAAAVVNGFIDALCNATNYTAPAAFWVKLHTGSPGAAGTSNAATNTTRKQASFTAAAGGAATTDASLDWTSLPATETYSHLSFWSASTGGTFLGSSTLSTSVAVTSGGNFSIAAGDLSISGIPVAS